MNKGGRTPKTYVSTFRLDLKPARPCCAEKPKENGLDPSKRMVLVNSELGISSSTDAKQAPIQYLEAPRFKEPLQNREASEGSDVTFQGKRVQSKQTSFTDGVATLVVCECSPGDAGIYTCASENTAGKQSSSAELHITGRKEVPRRSKEGPPGEFTYREVKPAGTQHRSASEDESSHREEKETERIVAFLDSPEQAEVRVGEQVRLHCAFRSVCVPVACCWIHNRKRVVGAGPRTCVQSSEAESSVEISQACSEDAGSYTVVVRNRRGTAQHTISLGVIDRPHPPSSQPVISQLSTQSLVLSWTGPGYDGGSAVLGYIVEVRQEGADKPGIWTELTTRCKNTSYRVHSGLEALGEYCFRVRAYNAAGVSEPGQESDCVKMASAREKKGEPIEYITVVTDTTHKVKDHYNVHEKLGVGKFGQVFRLTHKESGQECAGKFYRGQSSKDKKAAREEIELMNCLHHPKLVQCLAAYDTRSELVMVMEYIAGGELFERIVDDNFEHTEPTSARYMQQILEGMQYVHKQNIVHLDLKPENIVCVDTTGTRIKIIDFGLASKLEPGKSLMVMHGTPEFVAPEVINFEPVGLKTDLWSIGVICFILLSGECPFQGNNDAETLALVTAAHYEFDQESFEDISDQAKEFISALLNKDQRCRLSCDKALAHPWMASFTTLKLGPTKSLNKGKMRRFLAKRKWKKTGKAVLALQRMANLSNRPDSPGSPTDESCWSEEAEEAIQSLDKLLHIEPRFPRPLKDATLPKGATAKLTCHVNGYPPPEVEWLQNGELVGESSRVTLEQDEDGVCSLVLSDLGPSDSAVYKCRATNVLGKAICSAKLTVEL